MSLSIGPGITIKPGIKLGPTPALPFPSGMILNLDAGNPVSYSGSGLAWHDLSGAGNDFTFVDTPAYTSAGVLSYFNFGNVATSNAAILPNTAYTKVAVFRVYGWFGNIISGGLSDNDHAFWGGDTPYLTSGHNGSWFTLNNPTAVPTNQWVFGAVTFSTTDGWNLYLNNAAAVTNADTVPFTPDPAYVEIGGFQGNSNNMNGDVAVAQLYNRALTSAEIAGLYSYYQPRFSF